MSKQINQEMMFFISSVLFGAGYTFIYDAIRIFRRVFPHNNWHISIEDFFFWLIVAWNMFDMVYQKNDGIVRTFSIIGVFIGFLLYRFTVSKPYVNIVSKGLLWIKKKVLQGLLWCMKPIRKGLEKIKEKWEFRPKKPAKEIRNKTSWMKKKLTVTIKMVKMILCKR